MPPTDLQRPRTAIGILARHLALAMLVVGTTGTSPLLGQERVRVDFELLTEPGFPLGGERRWMESLQHIPNVRLRVRPARGGEPPLVNPITPDSKSHFQVQGILTAQNQLRLVGGTFRLEERRRIEEWIERLGSDGARNLDAPRGPFGLTEDQLLSAQEALQRPVPFSTQGMAMSDFLRQSKGLIPLDMEADGSARAQLVGGPAVSSELQGMSAGTALAIAMHERGVGVTLRRTGGTTRVVLVDPAQTKEFWPAGWPVERAPRQTVPSLFNYLNVEINDTPLTEALEAIQQRVEARFLFDRPALNRHKIDPREVQVQFNSGRTYYKRILDNLLYQAKLRSEIRMDDAGEPFLWITTIKK
jgi:hypothetical protein